MEQFAAVLRNDIHQIRIINFVVVGIDEMNI